MKTNGRLDSTALVRRARWPDASAARFGLANTLYVRGETGQALSRFMALTREAPELSAGWLNLSTLLARNGCPLAARQAAGCTGAPLPESPAPEGNTAACPVIRCAAE